MREIKFRVWDKEKKKLTDDFYFHEFTDVNCFFSEGCCAFSLDDVIFMQYTGLKDKNGVEIYEGDIIKKIGDIKTYSIVFDGVLAAYLMDDGTGGYGLNQMLLRDFEVIGNIYENPELLEFKNPQPTKKTNE
ncbi:YopX family protein [Campylobacter sp. RM16190]|uniref:YopX family protein n=1 Tax=Campylobacter sp. RM16190 TaxID=1705727 RepID=UPI001473AC87|nr:YopX family protein [Campylobacter sp. RM16190]